MSVLTRGVDFGPVAPTAVFGGGEEVLPHRPVAARPRAVGQESMLRVTIHVLMLHFDYRYARTSELAEPRLPSLPSPTRPPPTETPNQPTWPAHRLTTPGGKERPWLASAPLALPCGIRVRLRYQFWLEVSISARLHPQPCLRVVRRCCRTALKEIGPVLWAKRAL